MSVFSFISCRSNSIPTFEPFDGSSATPFSDAGTFRVWRELLEEVTLANKPRALLLDHGEESLTLRINLIRSAKKSISIQTFSWEFDEVGKLILWELIQANQQRGIQVKLLIDHMFNEHQPEVIALLSTLGPSFEIKYFNPSAKRLSPSFIEKLSDLTIDFHDHNVRLHNKLFLIDNCIALTGGRNINNHYFDQVIGMNYKDRDVLLILPSSTEITNCFYSYWNSNNSISTRELIDVKKLLAENNFSKSLQKKRFFEYDIFKQISARASNKKYIHDQFVVPLCEVERVEWIYDLPDKVDRAPVSNSAVTTRLLDLMKGAETDVVIQSPYVVLSSDIQKAFAELKQKRNNVSVVISTNSLAATDNWITYAANYKEKRVYLEELNLEMWEFKPIPTDISNMMNYQQLLTRLPFKRELAPQNLISFKTNKTLPEFSVNTGIDKIKTRGRKNIHLQTVPYLSLHAKSLVIDEQIAFVGSYNLDPRSEIYNTELGVIIYDETFSSQLKQSINNDIQPQNSYLIEIKKERPLLSKINMILYRISESFPFIDLWPIRAHSSFELKRGKEPVPPGHVDFFHNWKDVGNFPGLPFFTKKQMSARIFKATGMIFKPLL
ncbi:MAG: phospholipase D family protein [Opitutales bacterium]|nr:phospholipase D family protein [Opitutales bacterium]